LPIIPEKFEFKVSEGKKEQFNAVKKLFKESDVWISGVDIDREGSNIFYSIVNMMGIKSKPIKRLWINSLEVDEIRKGFKNLQSNEHDLKMYEEAHSRQLGDWLVGINASRLYTLMLQQKGLNTVLSVGRCSFIKKIDNLYVTNLVVSTSTKNGFIKKFEQKNRF